MSDNFQPKYPELDKLAERCANRICRDIDWMAPQIESDMPYKTQYVLEEMIKILQSRV